MYWFVVMELRVLIVDGLPFLFLIKRVNGKCSRSVQLVFIMLHLLKLTAKSYMMRGNRGANYSEIRRLGEY